MDYTLEALLDFFGQQDEHKDFYRQKILEKFDELKRTLYQEYEDRMKTDPRQGMR